MYIHVLDCIYFSFFVQEKLFTNDTAGREKGD